MQHVLGALGGGGQNFGLTCAQGVDLGAESFGLVHGLVARRADLADLTLEFQTLSLESFQEGLELFALRPQNVRGALQQPPRQADALGNRERVTAARLSQDEAEVRAQACHVEAHRRVLHAGGFRSEDFQGC